MGLEPLSKYQLNRFRTMSDVPQLPSRHSKVEFVLGDALIRLLPFPAM